MGFEADCEAGREMGSDTACGMGCVVGGIRGAVSGGVVAGSVDERKFLDEDVSARLHSVGQVRISPTGEIKFPDVERVLNLKVLDV